MAHEPQEGAPIEHEPQRGEYVGTYTSLEHIAMDALTQVERVQLSFYLEVDPEFENAEAWQDIAFKAFMHNHFDIIKVDKGAYEAYRYKND